MVADMVNCAQLTSCGIQVPRACVSSLQEQASCGQSQQQKAPAHKPGRDMGNEILATLCLRIPVGGGGR